MTLASFHVLRFSAPPAEGLAWHPEAAQFWQAGRCGAGKADFPSDEVTWSYLATWRHARDLHDAEAALATRPDIDAAWHVELDVLSRRGDVRYRSPDPFPGLPSTATPTGTVAVLTTLRIDYGQKLSRFREEWNAITAQLAQAPGLIASANMVTPGADSMTLTIWGSLSNALSFAYGPGDHRVSRDLFRVDPLGDATSFARASVHGIRGVYGDRSFS